MLWMFGKNKTLLLLSQVYCSVLAFVSLYAFDRSFLSFAAWLFLINHVSLTYTVQLSHTISKSFMPAAFCVKCQDSRQISDISLLLLSVFLTHQTNVTTQHIKCSISHGLIPVITRFHHHVSIWTSACLVSCICKCFIVGLVVFEYVLNSLCSGMIF